MNRIVLLKKYKNIKILSNGLMLLLITLVSKSSMFFLTLLCARYLTPSDFGKLSILRSSASVIEGIVTGVNGSLIISEINKNEGRPNMLAVILSITMFLFFSLSFFLLYNVIDASSFLKQNDLLFIILFSIFLVLSSAINFILIGKEWYKKNLSVVVISSLISLPLSVLFIVSYGFYGAIFSFTLFVVTELIFKVNLIYKKKDFFSCKIDSKCFYLAGRASRYILVVIPPLVLFWFLKFNLAKYNIVDLARFELIYQFLTIIMLITGAVSSASMKSFKLKEGTDTLKFSILVNFSISFLLILFFYAVGESILNFINNSYALKEKDYNFLLILLIALPFTLNSVFNKFFISKLMDYVNLTCAVLSISIVIIYIIVVGRYDMETLINSYLLYYSLSSAGQFLFLAKRRVIF